MSEKWYERGDRKRREYKRERERVDKNLKKKRKFPLKRKM